METNRKETGDAVIPAGRRGDDAAVTLCAIQEHPWPAAGRLPRLPGVPPKGLILSSPLFFLYGGALYDEWYGVWPDILLVADCSFVVGVGLVAAGLKLAARNRRRLRQKQLEPFPELDEGIIAACRAVGAVPGDLAAPVDRALAAYVAIVRLSRDPAWRAAGMNISADVQRARGQLLALLDRARRLAVVAGGGPAAMGGPDSETVAGIARFHVERLADAAAIFAQAQAALSRSLLALGSGPARPSSLESGLPEMAAAFQSLAEVLESLGDVPLPYETSGVGSQAGTVRLPPPREGPRSL
ncbi:MAG: hypothetical protein HY321_07590 [Armatimonadetes bacterium]|nr:hypothetical protein [Armatimonadota bacterium]